jgi:hypothetical protein
VNMLMKLRLHNVCDFITSKCASPTFLRRSYSTIVSPAKDKEDFIYVFIILICLAGISVSQTIHRQ